MRSKTKNCFYGKIFKFVFTLHINGIFVDKKKKPTTFYSKYEECLHKQIFQNVLMIPQPPKRKNLIGENALKTIEKFCLHEKVNK